MLELLALIVDDPLDLVPETTYPAEDVAIYTHEHPSSRCPILKNPYLLSDKDSNTIPPGIYDVRLSEDKTYFTLEQSNKILMIVPVVSIEEIKKPEVILTPKEEKKKKKEEKKREKKEKRMTEKERREQRMMEEQKLQAQLRASIFDSQKGYFVLRYKDRKYKATGYIPY